MPLIRSSKTYYRGDFLVVANPQVYCRDDDEEIIPEIRLALVQYQRPLVRLAFTVRYACISIVPYREGGYRFLQSFPCEGQDMRPEFYHRIMGRVTGKVDCTDAYGMVRYLRQVASRHHAYLYDKCMDWYWSYLGQDDGDRKQLLNCETVKETSRKQDT